MDGMAAPAHTHKENTLMDINKTLKELKQAPGFTEHVGMMLVHNGVVRGWARKDHAP